MPRYSLDVLGEVCPVPLLKTKDKIFCMASGETLVIETDFTRAVRNIMDWAVKNEHDFSVAEVNKGVWKLTIIKR